MAHPTGQDPSRPRRPAGAGDSKKPLGPHTVPRGIPRLPEGKTVNISDDPATSELSARVLWSDERRGTDR